jgi:hypothetical protein
MEGRGVEVAAPFSVYWMDEGVNSEIGAGGAFRAPCRIIHGGTAGRYASVAVDVVLPPIWHAEAEAVKREVYVDELKKLIYGGDVEKELLALLRSYGIPEEYAGEVGRRLRGLVREEVRRRGLPEEEWLVEALYRILVYMAHATLCAAEA